MADGHVRLMINRHLILNLAIVGVIVFAITTASRVARANPPVFSEASQRIMSVVLDDGLGVSDGIPIYPVGTEWYVPIGELSRALGIAVEVAPNLGKAQGFVLDESRKYTLDLQDCTVEFDGRLEVYECDEAAQYEDDIYVTVKFLTRTLPLKLSVNTFRSEVTVEPRQKLPPQLRKEREQRPGRSQGSSPAETYPTVDVPAKKIDGMVVDQQLGYTGERNSIATTNSFRHDTIAAGELIGMEASAFVHGTGRQIETQRYSLAKKSVDGELLGPLGAKDIQLIDVTIPSMPLIGGGGIYRGALISSYNLQSLTQFGTQDFIGDLPAGWEVELYQNDVLIDRRLSTNGRYEFKSVPLLYGANRFRLAFYGPQGQRRETYETYSIDSSFLQPNSQSYRFAFGDTQIKGGHWLAQYDRSLLTNVTLVSAFARTPEVKDVQAQPINYTLLGARAFTKNVLVSTTAAWTEKGGYAWENGAQGPVLGSIVGASYTRLSKFVSELYPIERGLHPKEVVKGNFAFNLFNNPSVRVTFEGGRTFYEEGGSNILFTQRTSTKLGDFYWFNTLGYDESAKNTTGELSTLTQVVGSELRATLGYDKDRVNSGSIEAQKRISEQMSVTLGFQNFWRDSLRRWYGSLSRQFEDVTLSANASTDSAGASTLGAILSYSLGREPREGGWQMGPKAQALSGAASVFVFLDANQNGQYESPEKPLSKVEIKVNQQNTGVETDEKGIAFIGGLTPYEAADVTISLRSLEDPFQKPSPKGMRFLPRPGKVAEIVLPIIVASELTGFVRTRDASGGTSGKTRRGLTLQLVTLDGTIVKQGRTETDGYYLLDDLRAGKYFLRIDPDQLKATKLKSDPDYYEIDITSEGLFDNVKDFTVQGN